MADLNTNIAVEDFMKTLPDSSLNELYESAFTCQMIFRSLPALAQQYVMRLLFVDAPVTLRALGQWAKKTSNVEHSKSVSRLMDLKVLQRKDEVSDVVKLNPIFRKSLLNALENPTHEGSADQTDKHKPNAEQIHSHAVSSWESVLGHILTAAIPAPSPLAPNLAVSVDRLLLRMGLVTYDKNQQRRLTSVGYRYMMENMYTQAWRLILAYIETAPERGMDRNELLTFLFQIGFQQIGKGYSAETLSDQKRMFLGDLCSFGLVYRRKATSRRYYPTRLGVNLSSTHSRPDETGFVILEPSFKIYANTRSTLQMNRLGIFCDLLYRLPNLVVAKITRDSCLRAFKNGVSAADILSFITINASPVMTTKTPLIPDAVSVQISIWEEEMYRVKNQLAVMFDQFDQLQDFENVEKFAREKGVVLWSDPSQMVLIVTPEADEIIRRFIRNAT